jgi:formate--tetrahydrofolate ligase
MTPTQATAAKAPITASQHANPRSDIEISQAAKKRLIVDIAREKLGIGPEHLEPYGHYKAKISMEFIKSLKNRPNGKLILVSAITPTRARARPRPRSASRTRSIISARRRCCACASPRSARRLA